MKGQIKINPKTGIAYIPENIRNEGFEGAVELLANAKTVTLLHPEATLEQIEQSLQIILLDIHLRMGKKRKSNTAKKTKVRENAQCPRLM